MQLGLFFWSLHRPHSGLRETSGVRGHKISEDLVSEAIYVKSPKSMFYDTL